MPLNGEGFGNWLIGEKSFSFGRLDTFVNADDDEEINRMTKNEMLNLRICFMVEVLVKKQCLVGELKPLGLEELINCEFESLINISKYHATCFLLCQAT